VLISFLFVSPNPSKISTHLNNQQHTIIKKKTVGIYNHCSIVLTTPSSTSSTSSTSTTRIMPLLSVSNVTVTELYKGSAKFGRPSTEKGAGWVVTADKGHAIIQKQINQDDNAVAVIVVRWTNYMDLDGLNGRIIPDLPILRQHDSVYFKTSSTTTRGNRHKAPFCFKFEGAEEAKEFEMCWRKLNGSIASGKEEDTKKKKADSSSNNKNVPLQDTTNATTTPLRSPKRKAGPMTEGPLRMKVKHADCLVCAIGGGDSKHDDENVSALSDGRANDDDDGGISDPLVVGLMPKEVYVNGKLRKIVKAKRSALKTIGEDSIDNSEDVIDDSNDDSNDDSDSNDDDSSNDSSGEDVIIDEEDAPQSQNWMTAFASY
jgi:hypothetical protein